MHKLWSPISSRLNELAESVIIASSAAFERMQQLLIVPLLALCGELCQLCDFFMTHKFQGDIWESVVLRLLRHYQCLRPGAEGRSSTRKLLELESTSPAILHRTASSADSKDDQSSGPRVKVSSGTDAKIQTALLLFVREVALSEPLSYLLQNNLAVLVWLVLAFLRSDSEEALASLAAEVLVALARHNSFKVKVTLHSVERGDSKLWGCLSSEIAAQKVQYTGTAMSRASSGPDRKAALASNDVLRSYLRDELFSHRVREVTARIDTAEECDLNWSAQLRLWSHV